MRQLVSALRNASLCQEPTLSLISLRTIIVTVLPVRYACNTTVRFILCWGDVHDGAEYLTHVMWSVHRTTRLISYENNQHHAHHRLVNPLFNWPCCISSHLQTYSTGTTYWAKTHNLTFPCLRISKRLGSSKEVGLGRWDCQNKTYVLGYIWAYFYYRTRTIATWSKSQLY